MNKQDIIDYVMETPENINPVILGQFLDEIGGGDTPIDDDTCIIKIIDDDETPFSPDNFNILIKSIILPSNTTSIDVDAFYSYMSLEDITIPEGITTIGDEAFYGCSSLKSIVFPASITNIGRLVLGTDCTSITMLATIPPIIDSSAFEENGNLVIYVPVESVDAYKEAETWGAYRDYIQPISNS